MSIDKSARTTLDGVLRIILEPLPPETRDELRVTVTEAYDRKFGEIAEAACMMMIETVLDELRKLYSSRIT